MTNGAVVFWVSNSDLALSCTVQSSTESSSGAALPHNAAIYYVGQERGPASWVKLSSRPKALFYCGCYQSGLQHADMVIMLLEMSQLAWSTGGKVRTALCCTLQSTDPRGQESLVVYFLSKYKFKQGVRRFCICSVFVHGSALLIMVELRVNESRMHTMVPAPKTGTYKLQLIIPLSCRYLLAHLEG